MELNGKYWIKTGVVVRHKTYPDFQMTVERVAKKTLPDKRVLILGVDCHWIDSSGRFQKGRFLTMDLIPYNDYVEYDGIKYKVLAKAIGRETYLVGESEQGDVICKPIEELQDADVS
jgi:hypothetical protein